MKFSLRQMEVFRAVMLTGSIRAAAQLLFASQPAVSRIIAHTEQTLGLMLFNRVKGKLTPTPEGEALFREVDEFYQQAVKVDEFARALALGPSGTLRIAASPSLSRGLMSRAIAQFVQRYPGIHVNFRTTLLNSMPQEVLSNRVDLAVSVHPIDHPNLRVEPFTRGRMVCVVPLGHELAQLATVPLAELARYPVISHDAGIPFGRLVAAAFERAGVELKTRINIHQSDMACSLARSGAGVAIVDEFTAEGMGWTDLQTLPLADEIVLEPSIVRSVFDHGRTHAGKFIEVLKQQAAREGHGQTSAQP
ncbi:LysR family transcriptional regulator [Caenimonas terrae]|uniref:LysR family transcriptional regulator n=1 Tax=Caenimonas terrae TaxID=696074 RepID=A0ABW0N8F6_9BURK